MARTLADIKKTHGPRNVEAEIREALKGIKPGEYETTVELAKRSGIGQQLIGPMHGKFSEYVIDVTRNKSKPAFMWARTPADAKKLREALKAQNG